MKRAEVRKVLVERGVRADWASQYADLFCEYQEAILNIERHGSIVQHPRTGNPITNPYLAVRDAAFRKLKQFRQFDPGFLWAPLARSKTDPQTHPLPRPRDGPAAGRTA